ncbi:unnamed protein product, partial [Polarella glacialis]
DFDAGKKVLGRAVSQRLASLHHIGEPDSTCQKVSDCHIRLAHVPSCLGLAVRSVGVIRHSSVGQYVSASGIVSRMGVAKAAEQSRTFQCTSCGHRLTAHAQVDLGCRVEAPQVCPGRISHPGSCAGTQFTSVGVGQMMDYQELRLQDAEAPFADGAAAPRSVTVVVTGGLVGSVAPGDSVVVGGVVRARWQPQTVGGRVDLVLLIEANDVRPLAVQVESMARGGCHPMGRDIAWFWSAHRQDEFLGRSKLVQAVAPSLFGMEVPKLAVLLTLIGGSPFLGSNSEVAKGGIDEERWARYLGDDAGHEGLDPTQSSTQAASESSDAARRGCGRLTPHLLLVGEPGTGKSKLLE